MGDKYQTKKEEIDFISSPMLKKVIKKSKMRQTIKYVIITIITTIVLLTVLFLGSQYILNKRIENQDSRYNYIHGANISSVSSSYTYNLFSAIEETTYRKNIGDRSILWDKVTKEFPLFGKVKTIELKSGMVEINTLNKEEKRYIRYNDLNNEREIDFYYPSLSYDYLPNELVTAVELDENKLIEVALSFNEPMTISEVEKRLGLDNVNWLWVDTTTVSQIERMERELDGDDLKTKGGGGAFGFDVSSGESISKENENGKWFIRTLEQLLEKGVHKDLVSEALKGINENTKSTNGNIRINGAVVTGTPMQLQRFNKLNFIRASVIGATIDKY